MTVLRSFINTLFASCAFAAGLQLAHAEGPEAPFGKYFSFDEAVPAQIVVIEHDESFIKMQRKILENRAKDVEKFTAQYEKHDAGVPYPWSEVLGLTKEEHEAYLSAWDKRKINAIANARLRLEKGEGSRHRLHIEGDLRVLPGGTALIRFNGNTGKIETLSATLERIEDVDTPKDSVLGEWQGEEWRGSDSDGLVTTTENFVVGERSDNSFCYLIYRKREMEADGRPVVDSTLLLRFLPKAKRQADVKPAE